MSTLYFAYGSNLNLDQILMRCPAIRPEIAATLPGWRLTFRGVADIEEHPGSQVIGALYRLTKACEAALDRYEGFNPHCPSRGSYRKEWVRVRDAQGRFRRAMVYVMNPRHYTAAPHGFYLDTIIEGYKDWGLPTKPLAASLRMVTTDRMVCSA